MFTKTKIAMAALLIAAFATPSLAQNYRVETRAKHERSYGTSLQLIEGRNAAVFGGTSTDRESLVQASGN